ncbi:MULTISPECIES: hypothetical protein [unclassified Paraburkholderia]|uniref:hypothetical protein n=1 Tax=unclassified Paraburkholderia TaxID=2615204 RepID=UPI00161BFF51|nr:MULTISPECIES: hypothetical protein [unclassified Paraburkholderia]MBB5446912.1 hypothetical protein [Paraburkholderia sp. WSM4177]MBB5487436.1 hypothetical protein [Paraburkholderia sp. WSM4180]
MYMNPEGAYGMALRLTVFMAGTLDQATADSLLERAKGICPYLDAWLRNIASARPPSRSRASMTTTETSCACSTRASARPSCLQQGRAGGNVVGLARRQYVQCGHDGDLDKRLRIKNDG